MLGTDLIRLQCYEGIDAGQALYEWDYARQLLYARLLQSDEVDPDHFGHPGLARGAVIVICSDGLEVGDPELLAAQMARLHRLAYRVIWLNPLKENPDYAPLARGMKAALPQIDVFAGGHDLASLEEIAETVAKWG